MHRFTDYLRHKFAKLSKLSVCKSICILGIALSIPLQAITRKEFLNKLSEPTAPWMQEQINHDLQPLTHQLSKQYIDKLFAQPHLKCIRLRVVNGQMSIDKQPENADHGSSNSYDKHFLRIHELVRVPDLDILVSFHDHLGDSPGLPVCILSKVKDVQGMILIPDWFALAGYEPEKTLVLNGNDKFPWDKKSNLMFFRGGDTGVESANDYSIWKQSVRPKLVGLSLQYPDLIDARFAKNLHHPQFVEQAKQDGYIGDYVPMDKYIKYKYLIDLDGNCASAPRLALLLHSNCVTFKAVTNSVQWFYRALHEWEHFIPIKTDFSDLMEKLEWAKKNPKHVKRISKMLVN